MSIFDRIKQAKQLSLAQTPQVFHPGCLECQKYRQLIQLARNNLDGKMEELLMADFTKHVEAQHVPAR